jgi:hypothetical protein
VAQRVPELPSQLLEQHIRHRSEQIAELIGPKPSATRQAKSQAVMQLLEPILYVAPLTIERIHNGVRLTEIRRDEPGIALGISSRQPDDLSLDNHPAATRPTSGGIEGVPSPTSSFTEQNRL